MTKQLRCVMTCTNNTYLLGQSKDKRRKQFLMMKLSTLGNTVKVIAKVLMDIFIYILYKVHKTRKLGAPVPTRPVCSDCGGITNPIGQWVDVKLQPVAQSMRTYTYQGLFRD